MPSAAKQKIPADLWHHRHGRYSPGHCGSMPASPGQSEVFQEDQKNHFRLTPKKAQNMQKNQKRQRTTSARGSQSPLPMRGSSDDLRVATVPLIDSGKAASRVPTVPVSASTLPPTDSISHIAMHISSKASNAFAMDAPLPPHPSELPLPPMEWLKPSSQSPLTIGRSLQTILACQVAA